MNELQAGIEFAFAVLPEPSALFQPSEGAFDDPAFGQYSKGVQFVALDDLHGSVQSLFDAVRKRLSGVSAIDQHAFNSLKIRPAAVDSLQGPAAISHLGRGDGNGMRKTLRIDSDVALDARDFFASVVTLLLGAIGVLHALRVNNQEAGHGVASLFGSGLANRFFLRPAPER